MRNGYISRRPRSINKESRYLAVSDKKPKFLVGPIRPKPGPILPIQVKTAVNPLT